MQPWEVVHNKGQPTCEEEFVQEGPLGKHKEPPSPPNAEPPADPSESILDPFLHP